MMPYNNDNTKDSRQQLQITTNVCKQGGGERGGRGGRGRGREGTPLQSYFDHWHKHVYNEPSWHITYRGHDVVLTVQKVSTARQLDTQQCSSMSSCTIHTACSRNSTCGVLQTSVWISKCLEIQVRQFRTGTSESWSSYPRSWLSQ